MSSTAVFEQLDNMGRVVRHWPLQPTGTVVGKDRGAHIQVDARGVEAGHATVRLEGNQYAVMGVTGRVRVNGTIVAKANLRAGDLVDVGTVQFRFRLEEAAAVRPRQPSGPFAGPQERTTEPLPPALRAPELRKLGAGADPRPVSDVLGSLQRFSEAIGGTYELDALLTLMLDEIVEVTHAARGAVLLSLGGRMPPEIRVARLAGRRPMTGVPVLSDSIVARVMQTRQAVVVSDAMSDGEFSASQSVMDFKLTSVLCVPLLVRGELLGVIYLSNENVVNLFSTEAEALATVFAAEAAVVLRNAILINELQATNQTLTQQMERMTWGNLVGASQTMQELFARVQKVAATDLSVLIDGETGTGKELVAGEIHRRSPRARGPFVVINCGAIPENLLESELFGHTKGAFTGAVQTRDGKFQAAHGGTLFLDEIGEMPLALQVKLLRVLEDRKVVRVGEAHGKDVDIRVIAATNRDLSQEVKSGNFREDLFYRLNVVRLHLPPLRDRGEDVLLLARSFLQRYCGEMKLPARTLSADAQRAMRLHRWPGNIRELENRIKKALVFCDGPEITLADLDLQPLQQGRIESLSEAKESFARDYVLKVLDINGGNRAQTAKDLGVDVRTIYRYLERDRDEPEL